MVRKPSGRPFPPLQLITWSCTVSPYTDTTALELTVPVEASRYLVVRVLVVVAGEELVRTDEVFAASVPPVVSKGGADDRFPTVPK